MGQLIDWPDVITEGEDIEECRAMLRDALNEMVLAYKMQNQEIPLGNSLIEQLPVEILEFKVTLNERNLFKVTLNSN